MDNGKLFNLPFWGVYTTGFQSAEAGGGDLKLAYKSIQTYNCTRVQRRSYLTEHRRTSPFTLPPNCYANATEKASSLKPHFPPALDPQTPELRQVYFLLIQDPYLLLKN